MTDLHITPKGVYLDGVLIDKVMDVSVDVDRMHGTTVSIEFRPDSVIYGDLPKAVVDEVLDAHTPVRGGKVDMERAMENARRRAQGLPVGAPVQTGGVVDYCDKGLGGGETCGLGRGHKEPCRP